MWSRTSTDRAKQLVCEHAAFPADVTKARQPLAALSLALALAFTGRPLALALTATPSPSPSPTPSPSPHRRRPPRFAFAFASWRRRGRAPAESDDAVTTAVTSAARRMRNKTQKEARGRRHAASMPREPARVEGVSVASRDVDGCGQARVHARPASVDADAPVSAQCTDDARGHHLPLACALDRSLGRRVGCCMVPLPSSPSLADGRIPCHRLHSERENPSAGHKPASRPRDVLVTKPEACVTVPSLAPPRPRR